MKKLTENQRRDKEVLISIVKDMASSMTGTQSTRHWADDALWFDIPAFAAKGIQPALKMFDQVFSGFSSCDIEFLEEDVTVNGPDGHLEMLQPWPDQNTPPGMSTFGHVHWHRIFSAEKPTFAGRDRG